MDDSLQQLMLDAVSAGGPEALESLPVETVAVLLVHLDDAVALACRRLSRLRALVHSGNSSLTDAGLALLSSLEELEVLDLEWSASITVDGLRSLAKLKNLRWLDISFCPGVSVRDVAELQQVLPRCEIEFYGG